MVARIIIASMTIASISSPIIAEIMVAEINITMRAFVNCFANMINADFCFSSTISLKPKTERFSLTSLSVRPDFRVCKICKTFSRGNECQSEFFGLTNLGFKIFELTILPLLATIAYVLSYLCRVRHGPLETPSTSYPCFLPQKV